MNNFQSKLYEKIAKRANSQNFAKLAKVTSVNPGGVYDVELGGGQVISNITGMSGYKFSVDQWVTLEFMGGDWVIAGNGAQRGGD